MSNPSLIAAVELTAATTMNVFGGLTTGAMFNLRFTNRSFADITLRVGLSTVTGTIQNAGLICYEQPIPPNGTFEITGLAIGTEYVVARSTGSSVSAVAYGVEL